MKEINIENTSIGLNTITFDGSSFPTGVYHYSLIVNGQQADTKTMIKTQ
jgi:hypothetical protein